MDKKNFRNIAQLFGAEGLTTAFSYFLVLVIAYSLGDEGVGSYGVVVGWTIMLTVIADMGLTSLIIREGGAKREELLNYLEQASAVRIGTIIIFSIAALVLYLLGGNFILISIAFILALTNVINDLLRGALIGLELHGSAAKLRIAESALFVLVGIVTLYLTQNLLLMFMAVIATNILIVIPGTMLLTRQTPFLSKKTFRRETVKETRRLFKEASAFWIMNVLGRSQSVADVLMLQFFTSLAVVGWYTASQNIIGGLLFIPVTICVSLIPTFARLHKEKQDQALKTLFHKVFYYMLIIAFPITTGIFLIAEPLITFLFPDDLKNATASLMVIVFSFLFFSINITMGTFLNSIRKQRFVATGVAIALLINLVINFLLIPQYQHVGAAVTTVLSRIFVFLFFISVLSTTPYGIKAIQLLSYMVKPLVASLAMVPVVFFLLNFHLFLGIAGGVTTYFIVIILIRGIHKEDVRELFLIMKNAFSSGTYYIRARLKRKNQSGQP